MSETISHQYTVRLKPGAGKRVAELAAIKVSEALRDKASVPASPHFEELQALVEAECTCGDPKCSFSTYHADAFVNGLRYGSLFAQRTPEPLPPPVNVMFPDTLRVALESMPERPGMTVKYDSEGKVKSVLPVEPKQ